MTRLKMVRAICEAFDEELERDPSVCLFGEDVGEFGGVFSTSARLQKALWRPTGVRHAAQRGRHHRHGGGRRHDRTQADRRDHVP